MNTNPVLFLLSCYLCVVGCDAPSDHPDHVLRDAKGKPSILSAYFGFDNGVNIAQVAGCAPYLGLQDGMPVVFDVEIEDDTLQATDLQVTFRAAGGRLVRVSPQCVGLPPAGDEPEDRTVLMVGQFGAGDGVLRVDVVDQLLDEDGNDLDGLSIADVTPLGRGPEMVYAEILPPNEWTLDEDGTERECPLGTAQIVQVTWQGGITNAANTAELGDIEREAYVVTALDEGGQLHAVTPFALGDLADGDNNNDLCLDVSWTPIGVAMPAGVVSDPGGVLNPKTDVEVGAL